MGDPLTMGLVAGGVGAVGNIISGDKAAGIAADAKGQADAQMRQAMALAQESVDELKALGIPTIEAQKIVLQKPEFAGLQQYLEQGPSALEDIQVDPRLEKAQMDALQKLGDLSRTGLTEEEKAQQLLMQRQAAGAEQARQKSILQSAEERGAGGGGAELAARLSSSQAAAERDALAQAQLSGQAQQRALQAMSQGAGLASQIGQEQFGRQAQVASAADRIAQFNLANRMNVEASNLARQQQQYNTEADLANQQEMTNKALIQQDYQNRLARQQAIANARAGQQQTVQQQASNTLSAGQAAAKGALQQGAAFSNLAGGIGGAMIQYGSKSSPSVRTQVQPSEDATAFTGTVDPKFGTYAADGGVIRKDPNPRTVSDFTEGKTFAQVRKERGYANGGVVEEEPQEIPQGPQIEAPNSNGGYAGGGIPVPEVEGMQDEEAGIVPMDEYAGDRVDAKVNSGEMWINLPQQQRLMELLKGYRDLSELGDEDILMESDEVQEEMACGGVVKKGYEDGGVVSSEEGQLAQGLHQEYSKMEAQEKEMKEAQKRTKARMKALETLMKG